MPTVNLDTETIDRLDKLRVDDESHDQIINELINTYEAEELTLPRAGDRLESLEDLPPDRFGRRFPDVFSVGKF